MNERHEPAARWPHRGAGGVLPAHRRVADSVLPAHRRVARRSRHIALCTVLAIGIAGPRAVAQDGAPRPPNVVLLLTDDAGYADFGFQGGEGYLTPHIDSLAADGIRFMSAYVTASVCSPSRAGLMTGRYQQRFGHEHNLPGMDDPEVPGRMRGLPVQERTIADALRAAGYTTGLVGKWHLGGAPRFRPTERGFDEFFGLLRGSGPYLAGTATDIVSSYRDLDAAALPYLTDAFGDEAVGFIERHRNEPFFLFLSFTAPHTPMQATDQLLARFDGRFRTTQRATNAAMTASIDDNVGKVLGALEAFGLVDDTLVIFTNDNGGAMPSNASLNEPLRGTKGTVLEGGNRVPMLMRWPARLPAGAVYDKPISTLDFLPTLAAAAGAMPTGEESLDGVNLVPYLTGARSGRPHDVLFWKLNWGAAIRRLDWKLVRTPAGEHWLFDLATDPGERDDRARQQPELLAQLRQELEAWEATLPAPIWVTEERWRAHSLERYDQRRVDSFRRR